MCEICYLQDDFRRYAGCDFNEPACGRAPDTDEDILALLRKVGYKAYDHEELRQYSKDAYDERDRLRAEEAAKEAERLARRITEKHTPPEAEEDNPDDPDSVDRDEPEDDVVDDEDIDRADYALADGSEERSGLNINEALGSAIYSLAQKRS